MEIDFSRLSISISHLSVQLLSGPPGKGASEEWLGSNEHHDWYMAENMNEINEKEHVDNPTTVLHWYDFLCPFCYVGQQRNAILIRHGLHVDELAFQAHPDIPPGGIPAGPRNGLMYTTLEREAREAGLPLHWPPRLPNTRQALAAAEWVRRYQPRGFPQLHRELFEAHFVLGEDLEDVAVIDGHASSSDVDSFARCA